jgi:hypothetical protein
MTTSTVILLILLLAYPFTCNAQTSPTSPNHGGQVRVIVALPEKSSADVIAIPPDVSWQGSVAFLRASPVAAVDSKDPVEWLQKQATLNGLESMGAQPWHIVIAYDQFDEDGDNVHSGTVEEFWAGPKKYSITYKADNLDQSDYATDQGLFRLGDQRWPNIAEMNIRTEVVEPFSYAAQLEGFRASRVERRFGEHILHCIVFENKAAVSIPAQYCFEPDGPLRYARGFGWNQTVYNDIALVAGHNIGRDVEVTQGGKPYLKLKVKTVEVISDIDAKIFAPPPDAVGLAGKRVTGVTAKPIKTSLPEWPASLRREHFSVEVEVVIGENGHVVSAHAVSGPSDAHKAAEATVRKWIFRPYPVVDEPAEMETKVILTNN